MRGFKADVTPGVATENFVAYLLPKLSLAQQQLGGGMLWPEEMAALQAEVDAEVWATEGCAAVDLEWVREYAYEVKSEADSYFFGIEPEMAVYNAFSSRMMVTRKTFCTQRCKPSRVTLGRRRHTQAEQGELSSRRQALMLEGHSQLQLEQRL